VAITVLLFIIIRLVVVVFIHMGLIKFIGRYRIKVLSLKYIIMIIYLDFE